MNKSENVQLDIKHKSEELKQSLKDLYAWEDEMAKKEEGKKAMKEIHENVPIRGSKKKKTKAKNKNAEKLPDDNKKLEDEDKKAADEWKERGNKCIKLGDFKGALECYACAIKQHDKDPIYFANRGYCYLNLDMYELSIADCNKAIQLDETYAKAYYRRMQALEAFGDNVGAYQDGLKVLGLSPDSETCIKVQKDMERIDKRIQDAEAAAKARIFEEELNKTTKKERITLENEPKIVDETLKPKSETNKIGQKSEEIKSQKKSSVGDLFKKEERKVEEKEENQSNEMAMQNKENEMAMQNKENEAATKKEADKWKEQGNNHISTKEFDKGLECYTKAIRLYDKEPIYFSNRGHCYYSLKNYGECVSDCNHAIDLNPKFFRPYFRRMQAYEQLEKFEDALLDCVKVLELTNEEKQKTVVQAAMKRIKVKIEENKKLPRSNSLIFSDFPQGEAKLITFSNKAPALRSKKPLRRIQIEEVYDPDDKNPPYLADENIPVSVIDKIFNNNTGENVEEFISKHEDSNLSNLFPSSSSSNLRNMFAPVKPKVLRKEEQAVLKLTSPKSKSLVENEKTNKEILNAENKRQPPKTDEEEVKIPAVPTALPKSPSEFFLTWETLKMAQKYEYLKRLAECSFEKIIGVDLTSNFLSELLQILDQHGRDENLPVLHILKGVCKNDQMTILPLMFSEDDQKAVKNLVQYLEHTEGEGLKNKDDVEFIKKKLHYN